MIPDELKLKDQWVCCTSDSKIPYKAWEYDPASTTNPADWSDYEMAAEAIKKGYYQDLGFVFNNDYVGIDIDTGFDEYGLINARSMEIILKCKSYCEKSRSGRGFHIILKGTLPFSGANNRDGLEIYTSGRFFVMTGKALLYSEIIENQEAIDFIVDKYFQSSVRENSLIRNRETIYKPVWSDVFSPQKVRIQPVLPEIRQGCRNISLLSYGGYLLNIGYSQEHIRSMLVECNKQSCKPPLSDNEVNQIFKSVIKYRR